MVNTRQWRNQREQSRKLPPPQDGAAAQIHISGQRFMLSLIACAVQHRLFDLQDNMIMDGICLWQCDNSWSLESCFVTVDGICCRRMLVSGTV